MKRDKWPVDVAENLFGSFTECPKCGNMVLSRTFVNGSDDQHFEVQRKDHMSVKCTSCYYVIGNEKTKDHQ